MTGDASVNPQAPVLCCTAEILANMALAHGGQADLRVVIMDEFHYYSDPDRGYAWQVPLLTMPQARFLLMSATLGPSEFFERELTRLTGAPAVTVRSDVRPVPLEFEYSEAPLTERVEALLAGQRAPVYLVHFTQREAAEAAQNLMSLDVCSKEEKSALAAALEQVRFNSPYGREMKRWLRAGIGVHHAGLLPKYRVLVETLAQQGLLKLICGTDTLGLGINVPIRTVVFTQLWKYDGHKAAILTVRDFRQIAGRAGRKGFDDRGYVVVQAPEHVVENKRAEEKAAGDAKKQRKLVKRRPPDGFVGWDANTFERLRTAPMEGMVSRFEVTHGMLLLVLSREADGCRVMRRLIDDCHETPHRKRKLRHRAWQLFRSLLERKIVEWIPPEPSGRKLRVNVELQDDFSLHQALSLYLIDTLPLLDRASPDYPFDVLTLCEAIVEDPEQILRKQVDRLKTDKMAEMRAAGVPYEERIAKLDEIEHPKPLREFLYDTFNTFAAAHPWVEEENIRPKSIAREMYERYLSFAEYIRGLRAGALGGVAAPASVAGLEGAGPDGARRGQDRRGGGNGDLLPRADPWNRFESARGMGAPARSRFRGRGAGGQAGAAGCGRRDARRRGIPAARADRYPGLPAGCVGAQLGERRVTPPDRGGGDPGGRRTGVGGGAPDRSGFHHLFRGPRAIPARSGGAFDKAYALVRGSRCGGAGRLHRC